MKLKNKFVELYQCPGCVSGDDCFKVGFGIGCANHVIGTMSYPNIGKIILGLPNGFNRIGSFNKPDNFGFFIFKDVKFFDRFNIPVWKRQLPRPEERGLKGDF